MEELSGNVLSSALKAVDEALPILQQNPNDSAQTLVAVVVELSHSVKDEEGLKRVVEHIFQECLHRSDNHVACAQLCAYLSTHLVLDDAVQSNFRKVFLSRCQSIYVARNELVESYVRRKELTNFTEFMAQVLIHMRVNLKDSGKSFLLLNEIVKDFTELNNFQLPNGSVMDPFPEVVIKLMTAVLQAVSEESIHCVNQVLQSTGSLLDQSETQRPAFEALFNSIRDIYLDHVFKPEQQKILLRLILLKDFKWIPNDYLNDI